MLFYKSKKGSLIPITTIKAVTSKAVVLLTGEVLSDKDPQFVEEHGTENYSEVAAFRSIKSLAAEVSNAVDSLRETKEAMVKDIADMRYNLNLTLKEAVVDTQKLSKSVERRSAALEDSAQHMKETSEYVQKLGGKLIGYLDEMEEKIAEETAL